MTAVASARRRARRSAASASTRPRVLALEQQRVLQRDGGLRRQQLERQQALGRERAGDEVVLEVEERDDLRLPADRQAEHRAGAGARQVRVAGEPAGVGGRVVEEHALLRCAARTGAATRGDLRAEARPRSGRGAAPRTRPPPRPRCGPSRARRTRARRAPPVSRTRCRSVRSSCSRTMSPEMVCDALTTESRSSCSACSATRRRRARAAWARRAAGSAARNRAPCRRRPSGGSGRAPRAGRCRR